MGCRPGNNILSPSIYMCWGFPSDYFSRQIFREEDFLKSFTAYDRRQRTPSDGNSIHLVVRANKKAVACYPSEYSKAIY